MTLPTLQESRIKIVDFLDFIFEKIYAHICIYTHIKTQRPEGDERRENATAHVHGITTDTTSAFGEVEVHAICPTPASMRIPVHRDSVCD